MKKMMQQTKSGVHSPTESTAEAIATERMKTTGRAMCEDSKMAIKKAVESPLRRVNVVNVMGDAEKTHYRRAFNSPYLSSADLVGPTILTIQRVALDPDKTKRTKDVFNTAYFVEKTIRQGEVLKPMILNAVNSKTMKALTQSAFIDDWANVRVEIFVDRKVRFGRDTVEGLRISPRHQEKPTLTPTNTKRWEEAKRAVARDGNLAKILTKVNISEDHQKQLVETNNEVA